MKQTANKQYEEYQELKRQQRNGEFLTVDGLRFICQAHGYDAEKIGEQMLENLAYIQARR